MASNTREFVLDAFRALFGDPERCALILTSDHEVLEGTAAARRLFGLPPEGVVSARGILPAAITNAIDEAFRGRVVRLDFAAETRDGTTAFEVVVQPAGELAETGAVLLLAVASDGRRPHEELEGELLARIALAVSKTASVTFAVEETMRNICQATGWPLGEAWIPQSSEGGMPALMCCGSWTSEKGWLETFTTQATGLRFNRGEGVPGAAWDSGRPVWVGDLATSRIFTRGALAAISRLKAAVAIPLMYADDDFVGVLQFYMRDVPANNDELVKRASAVATPLAQLLRQKQSEEAHRLAEARFIGMVSMASDAIISIDGARRITLFNWGAERIFGYSSAEAIGQLMDMLLPEDVRSRHAAHIAAFAASSDTTRRMGERSHIVGRRKNGELFPAEASISRFLVGREWGYTAILRDVSERVRREDELRVLAERMRKAANARDEVMALVSHDLRNPLSTMSMCLSALHDDPPPTADMAHGLVMLAEEAALLMSRMIQDLLDIASIDAGQLSIERTKQAVGPTLEQAVEMHRPIAADQQITLVMDLPPGLEEHILMIDRERIVQALSNLIANGCKFTRAGGSVTVSAVALPDAVQVTVRDTGRGIPVDAIPHVFDRFWHARHGAAQRSTGLGLAIVRGIIEAHGGRIWVESTVGEGSAFHFTLPSLAVSDNGRHETGEVPHEDQVTR